MFIAEKNDVIQVAPNFDSERFRFCFAVVEETTEWGARAYVLLPSQEGTPATKIHIPHEQYAIIGKAPYVLEQEIPF
jgi:hypothetical protein